MILIFLCTMLGCSELEKDTSECECSCEPNCECQCEVEKK
mgnify:CR=1 FL=1